MRASAPWVMNAGYLNNDGATAVAWRNGWFHTGDALVRTEDGEYMFVDRLKDVIRRRGENISSFEVEADVLQNPEIVEAAAVAVPADTAEDEILLFAVKRSGSSISPEVLCADLESRMARFMVPRYIEFVEELPKTQATQRIIKSDLRHTGPGSAYVGPAEQGVSQSSECVVKLGIVRGAEYDDRRRRPLGPAALSVEDDWIPLWGRPLSTRPFRRSPFPYYRALRDDDPVHYEDDLGMYLVSRHEDLMTVLRDPIVFSQELGYYRQMAHGHLDEMKDILISEGGGFFPDVANIDPPRHTRVRRLLSQAFSRRRMKSFEPQFERLVDELIDGFVDRGEADGLHDLALPMAIAFSMQQLQVDDLDMSTIKRWGSAYLSQFSLTNTREDMIRAAHELCEMQNYLIALVRKRLDDPEDDMLSDIIRAERRTRNP